MPLLLYLSLSPLSRLNRQNEQSLSRLAKYIELDFTEVTTKKAMAIKKNKELVHVLGEEVVLGTFHIGQS